MKTLQEINEFLARDEFGEHTRYTILENEIIYRDCFTQPLYTNSFDSQIPLLNKYKFSVDLIKCDGGGWMAGVGSRKSYKERLILTEASARALVDEIIKQRNNK